MILFRKDNSLSYSYLVSFLGIMTHLVQAKDGLDINTTAGNVKIKQKIELQQNVTFLRRLIPGLVRWFISLKEIVITKGFEDSILKYVTIVF